MIAPNRLPPQNINAEIGVLACMFLDEHCIDDIRLILKEYDFYRDSHIILCGSIFTLRDSGKPVNSITVEEYLRSKGELDKVGGIDGILDIQGSEPDTASALYWARLVLEASMCRDIIDRSNASIEESYERVNDAETILAASEQRIFSIRDGRNASQLTTGLEAGNAFVVELEARARGEFTQAVVSPWSDLNRIVPWYAPGQFIIIGARPSIGKTSMAIQMGMASAYFQKHNVLFASLEMRSTEIGMRMISVLSAVGGEKFSKPETLTEGDRRQIDVALNIMSKEPKRFIIDDTSGMSVAQIAAQARRIKARSGLGLVIVDYIQLINPPNEKDQRQEQVSKISKALKGLARDVSVPVIALSQLNRNAERRDDKKPSVADLRDSGSLEQDADIIMLLSRPEYYDPADSPGMAYVNVVKNRSGLTEEIPLAFVKRLTRFDSIARIEPPQQQQEVPY